MTRLTGIRDEIVHRHVRHPEADFGFDGVDAAVLDAIEDLYAGDYFDNAHDRVKRGRVNARPPSFGR